MATYAGTDGLTYVFDNNVLTVSGTGQMNSLRQGILSTSGGGSIDVSGATSFVVSEGVTRVCFEAFSTYQQTSQNESLVSVSLASTVTSIENNAFYGCIALESVTVSATSISVGSSAFNGCSSLQSFPVERISSIGNRSFYNCTALSSIVISSTITSIPDYAFYGVAATKELVIPSTVSSIGLSAFQQCTGLTTLTIEYHAQQLSIGTLAFQGCTSLEILKFLTGGTGAAQIYLGEGCFANCSSLQRVNLPRGTTISTGTFRYCTSLEIMVFSPSQTSIPSQVCLGCTSLSIVCIPDGWTSISSLAFYGCTSLKTVLVGNCIDTSSSINISQATFEGCTALEEVRFGSGHLYFDQYVFRGCTSFKKLVLLDSASATFGYQAFMCGMVYNETSQRWEPAATVPNVLVVTDDDQYSISNQDYVTFTYDTYDTNAQIYSVNVDITTGYGYDTPIYPSPDIQISIGAPGQSGGISADTLILMESGYLRGPLSKQIIPSVLIYQEGWDTRISVNIIQDEAPISGGMPALYDHQEIGPTFQSKEFSVTDYDILIADLETTGGQTSLNLAVELVKALRVVYTDDPEFLPDDPSLSVNVPDGYYPYTSVQNGKTIVLPSVDPEGPYGVVDWYCPDTGEEYPLGGYARLDPNAPQGVQTFYGRWGLLFREDELDAMIIFSPGGGTFNRATGSVQFATEVGEEPIGHITYDPLKRLWVWWAETLDRSEDVHIKFKMPISNETGLTVPEGMEYVQSWYVSAPYFNEVPDADRVIEYIIRETTHQDSQIRRTFYPLWYPARRPTQSMLLVTPGYGTIDMGHIQSISETYNASLKSIPIVCYGYSGAFCMDLGVEKDISVEFIRTSLPLPADPAHPTPYECDDSSADSKRWTNAKWISFLKTLMDRWQMMSNGSLLYLLRPSSERLMTDADESAVDPMSELYTEIIGEHCYITQVPVVYSNTPQTISGSLSIAIGTIYPKSPEAELIKVKFYGLNGQDPVIRKYPLTSLFLLPDPVEVWGTSMISETTRVVAWKKSGSDTLYDFKTLQQMNTFLMPGTTNDYRVYAETEEMTDADYVLLTSNGTVTIYPTAGMKCMVSITAVGAGGGGGGTSIPVAEKFAGLFSPKNTKAYGGGGGGSGYVSTWPLTISTPIELDISIGIGGNGGVSGYYDTTDLGGKGDYNHASDGVAGGPTIVTIRTQTDEITRSVPGGLGGNSGENEGTGGGGYRTGGNGGKRARDDGTPGEGDGNGGSKGYAYAGDNSSGDRIEGDSSGGGGGAGGYLPTEAISAYDLQRLNNARGSNGQGASPDGYDSDNTSAGYGGGGGGGGGRADYDSAGISGRRGLWGIKGYPGKRGGNGWVLIYVSGGTIDV